MIKLIINYKIQVSHGCKYVDEYKSTVVSFDTLENINDSEIRKKLPSFSQGAKTIINIAQIKE